MSKPVSLYLTDRSMSAFRPTDSNSGRVNRIIDRYLEVAELEGEHVRALFSNEEWATLGRAWTEELQKMPAQAAWTSLVRALGGASTPLGGKVDQMIAGDFFVLIELLEREQISTRLEQASRKVA